ncbi:hypothetical protein V0288_05830 [Pannus brasiliensis CCIBt3594]|uniref:Uncharacterized protein n=1 Tax=Pannus brasiliensis CCIBt3594 TaxID=1427578 RepID=A0AAW9QHV2_9CHRO
MYIWDLQVLKESILGSGLPRFCIFRYKTFADSLKKSVISRGDRACREGRMGLL